MLLSTSSQRGLLLFKSAHSWDRTLGVIWSAHGGCKAPTHLLENYCSGSKVSLGSLSVAMR